MSRYLLDGRSLQDGSAVRGIGTYLRGLLGGFIALGKATDIELLLERGAPLAQRWSASGVSEHPSRLPHIRRHLRPLLDPLYVGRALVRKPPDLYHGIEFAQPILPRVPVVVTVHDLIPFVMPDLYPWMRRERQLSLRQLRHADAVIAVSRSTARDLVRIGHVDPARITVIPEAVAEHVPAPHPQLAELRARLRLPRRFVLAVGTFDPRKRIGALVEVVRRLRRHHDVGLVIAGFQGNFAKVVERSVEEAGLTPSTRVLGYVADDVLEGLYQLTECLVFTSAYEGFGLPPLEALSWGAPVAAFDNSSLAEVLGDAGLLIPDGDARAMADAVGGLIGNRQRRQEVSRGGLERAAMFSWQAAAGCTLDLYARLLAQH